MKTSRTLTKILSLALVICMMFSFASCEALKGLFGGSLKLESFTVDRSSVKTSYFLGEEIDFSGIRAIAKYSDSSLDKEYTADELNVTYAEDITATVGQKEVKVSFQDPHLNVEQSTTVQIVVSEDPSILKHESYRLDATNVKTNYNLGEAIDLTGLKLYDVMNDKSEVEITDLTGLSFGDLSAITATEGTKEVSATYNGEAVTGTIIFRVVDPASSKNYIVSATAGGSYKTVYELGETLDLTGLAVTLTYKDGTTVNVTAGFTADSVDMATAGSKNVKVNFTDPVNNEATFVSIAITVVKKDVVNQFIDAANIEAFNTDNAAAGKTSYGNSGFAGEFAVGGQTYKIGDDNEFVMIPRLRIMENGMPSAYVNRYYTDVDIYVLSGTDYVKLEKTAVNYITYNYTFNGQTVATVDTYNGKYQFHEYGGEALGDIKIVVRPHSDYYTGSYTPVELAATVIDAYNVTEAWQLGLVEYNFEGDRRAMWDSFKLDKGLAKVNEDGAVEHLFVNGIVLHGDLELTADDVPQDYFYVSTQDVRYINKVNGVVTDEKVYPAGTRYLKFRKQIFSHDNTDFVIEGNFFTIDLSKFPTVATPTVVNDKNISSTASENALFQFHNVWEVTGPEATMNNLMFIGNAARDNWVADNGNEESPELLSAGGLILVRATENGVINCNNILSNSCFINYIADWHGTINVKNSKTYDAFQNAIFVCRNSTFTAENSYFIGTGGPVIIAQSEYVSDYNYKAANTNITNCVLDTHLVGDELWFKSINASSEAMKIAALGAGVQQIVAALTGNTVNVTWLNGEGKMNIKGLLMRSGGVEGLADGYVQGKLMINGVGFDRSYNIMNLATGTPQTDWERIMLSSAYQSGKQIFTVYDAAGAHRFYFDQGTSMLYDMSGNALYASGEATAIFTALATANVIFMDYGGLSVALELYH